MNATSGNISPNPDPCPCDVQGTSQETKSKDTCQAANLQNNNHDNENLIYMRDKQTGEEGRHNECNSSEEEEDEEAEDDEEPDLHISLQGCSSKSDMSLEEARYTLQHIKSEALIDEDSKKSMKPPYRFEMLINSKYIQLYLGYKISLIII